MSIINFDKSTHEYQRPTLLLKTRSGETVGKLNYTDFNASLVANGLDGISFTAHKTDNEDIWDKLEGLKIVDWVGYGLFEATVTLADDAETTKSVSGESLETELGQRYLRNFNINDTDTITNSVALGENLDKSGTFITTKLFIAPGTDEYDTKNENIHSLLHRALENAPHWQLGDIMQTCPMLYVDDKAYSISGFVRDYTIDGTSIYDFLTQNVAEDANVVFEFDSYTRTINMYSAQEVVYNRDTFEAYEGSYISGDYYYIPKTENGTTTYDSYKVNEAKSNGHGLIRTPGEDTNILVTQRNLGSSMTVDEDVDSVKNMFYVKGGDDLMTNMVAAANLTGENYIINFANFQYDDMSTELQEKLKKYQEELESREDEFYGTGGIYVPNDTYTVDPTNPKRAIDQSGAYHTDVKIVGDTVYVLDTLCYKADKDYYLNGAKVIESGLVYNSQDTNITDFIEDADVGIYTQYCTLLDRYLWERDSRFPNTDKTEKRTSSDILKLIQDYFNTDEETLTPSLDGKYNYITNSTWTPYATTEGESLTEGFLAITKSIEKMCQVIAGANFTVEVLNKTSQSETDYKQPIMDRGVDESKEQYTGRWTGTLHIYRTAYPTTDYLYAQDVQIVVEYVKDDEIETNLAYVNQKLQIAIANSDIANLNYNDIDNKYKDREERKQAYIKLWNQYNLNSLDTYANAFNECKTTLQDTISSVKCENLETSESVQTMFDTFDLRFETAKMVLDYRQTQIDDLEAAYEVYLKENDDGTQTGKIPEFRADIDMRKFIDTDKLWNEYQAYIREDEYTNENFISDGLDTSGLLENAKALLDDAHKELKKACVLQKTISGNVNNIFAQTDLEKLWDKFDLYNYIRCEIDDKIYKLQLLEIDFDENALDSISVKFAEEIFDVEGKGSDLKSILDQVSSISTSYSATTKAAAKGTAVSNVITNMRQEGLNAANYVIKNSNDEEVIIDRNGINVASMGNIGEFTNNQARLVGSGLYFTTDGWDSVKSALGLVKNSNGEWVYGLIADYICGDLIAGQDLIIKNSDGSVEITGDGIKITNGTITWGSSNVNAPTISDIGNLANTLTDLQSQLDGEITSWFGKENPTSENEPAKEWTTEEIKKNHVNDLYYNTATGEAFKYTSSYTWDAITDAKVKEALDNASKAQDTADGKRTTFYSDTLPTTYSVGDIWVVSNSVTISGVTYGANVVLYASTGTSETHSAALTDWKPATTKSAETVITNLDTFKSDVSQAMGLGTTIISKDSVISPKIGGGYLYITSTKTSDDTTSYGYSVEIDPNQSHSTDGYIFRIQKDGTTPTNIFSINTSGDAYFNGAIESSSANITGGNIKISTDYMHNDEISLSYIAQGGAEYLNSFTSTYLYSKVFYDQNNYATCNISPESIHMETTLQDEEKFTLPELNITGSYIKYTSHTSAAEKNPDMYLSTLGVDSHGGYIEVGQLRSDMWIDNDTDDTSAFYKIKVGTYGSYYSYFGGDYKYPLTFSNGCKIGEPYSTTKHHIGIKSNIEDICGLELIDVNQKPVGILHVDNGDADEYGNNFKYIYYYTNSSGESTTDQGIILHTKNIDNQIGSSYLGMKTDGQYYGMAPNGNSNLWLRTTMKGIIPEVQVSLANGGYSNLGTSSWSFNEAYIYKIYGTLVGNASTATKASQDADGNSLSLTTSTTYTASGTGISISYKYQKYGRWVRANIQVTLSASVDSGDLSTAVELSNLPAPTGFGALQSTYTSGARALVGNLTAAKKFSFKNCGASAMTSSMSAGFVIMYLC